jgi:hypothetical protein
MNATPPPAGSNSIVVQPCQRCGSRWQVRDAPAYWCPKCDGVLGAPVAIAVPAPPVRTQARPQTLLPPHRRNYRWIARPPVPVVPFTDAPKRDRPRGSTPHYTVMPRWGLRQTPPTELARPGTPLRLATGRAAVIVVWTAIVFLLSAAAEIWRYVILLRSRDQLIGPVELWFSDQVLNVVSVLALAVALAAAYCCVDWLLEARRTVFARVGRSDTRTRGWTLIGCLVPVLNLFLPGVLLTELAARISPRMRVVVRIWWGAWAASGVMSVVSLCWHTADSVQERANGVLFSMLTDLVAVAVAVLTLWVIRETDERDLLGRRRVPKRKLISVGPVRPVIEPIAPGAAASDSAAPRPAPDEVLDKNEGADPAEADQDEEVPAT